MLYFIANMECPHCLCKWQCALVAETEPTEDTVFRVRCPEDGGPLSVCFPAFQPCEPFPATERTLRYPPRPKPRWWQFWKR